jgi:diguanylate cyclase (GGDEF)-like protein
VASAIHSAAAWLVEVGQDLTATVALLEDESGTLQIYESLGPLSQGRSGRAFPSSDSVAGWVCRSGGTVRRNRLRLGERPVCTLSPADEQGRRAGSCAASPLVCSGRIAGVILLESQADDGFGPGSESSVTLASSLLGLTLEKLLLEEQRQMLHCRDGLTGLPVLSDVMEYLLHATRDVQRFGKSVAVIVTGIDSLPEANSANGYRYGDSVLRACAGRLRDLAGDDAMVARVGGDRFAICLIGADRARVEAVGDCVLRSFADRPLSVDGREENISVSVGACTTRADRRVQQLLAEACRALSSARQAGGRELRIAELSAVPRPGAQQ